MKFELWHAFVLGAVLSWGVYVPVLHEGQTTLGGDPKTRGLRAFLCVGLAYFVTAVVVPVGLMWFRNQTFDFTPRGVTFASLGGIAGAAGALCIILSIGALKLGESPIFIAPLVFAGAPIVNVLVSLIWKTKQTPGPLFFVGIMLAAVGAGLVLYSKNELDEKLKKAKQTTAPTQTAAPAASAPIWSGH
jgi:drug/metabolite transporter (DMT)-like permease